MISNLQAKLQSKGKILIALFNYLNKAKIECA